MNLRLWMVSIAIALLGLFYVSQSCSEEQSASAVSFGTFGEQSSSSAKLILEVINRHFTVGRKIRSVYLRVYSDGTAECHTEKYWDEPDVVKHKTLDPGELQRLQVVLDNPELLHVSRKYGLMALVVDSWMEWDIRVPPRLACAENQGAQFFSSVSAK